MKRETAAENSERSNPAVRPSGENRRAGERRQNQRARFKYLLFNGRRERLRRAEDNQKAVFFDRYPPKLFAAIAAILMLSIFDALLTLILISKGSTELNPVMDYFLQHGLLPFIVAKYILTSFGVVILLIFKNVFLARAKIYTHSLFPAVIITFAAVIVWELILIITSI